MFTVVAMSAQAQTAPAQAVQQLERVEVTGSNIKRLAAETASPVTVVSRTEIKQSGANTVRQILDTITSTSTNELTDNGNSSSFAAGATGASLRGLGKGATLVLLNGRRVAYYALADGAKETFVNVDSIPADAIERIEVLKDGASAVYGSDAMAGVINIITRKDYQGVGISANYQTGTNPSLQKQATASVVGGFGNMAKDRFNVLLNAEFYKREGYTLADALSSYAPYYKQIVSPALGDPSLVSYPGNLFKGNARTKPVAGCPTSQLNAAGACTTDVNALNQIYDPAKRVNLFASGRFLVSEAVEAFAEASYSKTQTDYLALPFGLSAPGTQYKWFDGNSKKVQLVNKPLIAANNPANSLGVPAGLEYRFMDDLSMWSEPAEASQYRVQAGLKGTFGNWDWETVIGRTAAEGEKNGVGAHRVDFINAVSSGEYKIGGSNSAELLNRMFRQHGLNGSNSTNYIDAKLSGELFSLPAGAVMGAFGLEHREESVLIKSTENVLNAELIGRGSVWIEGDRKLDAAFAEVEAPLFKGLTANAAVRYDKATGFDGHMSPKLGLRYEVLPQMLMLRGTLSEGFRAPNIPETLGKVGLTGFFNRTVDPKRCETATKIRDILKKGNANDVQDSTDAFNSGCSVSVPAMISANPNVKPELSRSATIGFVFDPVKNLSIAVDYYKIERRDEISYRDPDYVLAREGDAGYKDLIARVPVSSTDQARADRANQLDPTAKVSWAAGELVTLLLQYENFGKTESSGIDLDIKGQVGNAEFGTLRLGLTSTYALTAREWDIDANTYRPNRVGLRNTPRLRSIFSVAWTKYDWTAGLRFNYTSGTKLNNDETDESSWSEAACQKRLNPGAYPCYIDSYLRTDLNVSYRGFKGLTLGLNIGNVMNNPAPVNLRDTYSIRPRTIKVSAEYRF
ncbi:iron complex outermembrane receptor protein [Paucibacter oligotrophus]|uniref:Iron complex outermembrane receptor protein n=1 Tax=Roseateles oligotrophus TaxID=1769250 RepID=A0A840L3I9_9BURK|nr:iron complex outermembrane receptor protein [Roseateles oligotrophus]